MLDHGEASVSGGACLVGLKTMAANVIQTGQRCVLEKNRHDVSGEISVNVTISHIKYAPNPGGAQDSMLCCVCLMFSGCRH